MKKFLLPFTVFFGLACFSQTTDLSFIKSKMQDYYNAASPDIVVVQISTKSSLGYDTSIYMNAFVPKLSYNKNAFAAAYIKPDTTVGSILLFDGAYYIISADRPEKIKLKNSNLPGAGCYPFSKAILESNPQNIDEVLGTFKSTSFKNENYQVLTGKYLLQVDKATYQVKSQIKYDYYKGKVGFTQYDYISLDQKIKDRLLSEINVLAESAKTRETTSYKEMRNEKPDISRFENTKFQFSNQSTFNRGILDSAKLAGKYVIYDFFYRACMPCHKMTGYILDWLPSADTSKIMLTGINPVDSEDAMREFAKERNINYPVIMGKEASAIAKYYSVHAYPTLILVSPDGTIMNINEGMSKTFLTKAEKIMAKANKTLP